MVSSFLTNLTAAQQNMIYFQAQEFNKYYFFFLFLVFSLYYVMIMKPNQKETPFYSVGIARLYYNIISCLIILTSPLQFVFLIPEIDLHIVMIFYFTLYSVGGLLYLAVVFFDILYFGFGKFIKMVGLDIKNKRIQEGLRRLFPNRRFD